MFADADYAGEHDSKSTTGCTMVLVGPNTYYPINAFSKKQTVTSMSSTEAEVVAANTALRAEGIPTLALFEQLSLIEQSKETLARCKAKPPEDDVFVRIDPEIDTIRNGNLESGHKASDIHSLKAHFPPFSRVKVMEDNQATITILRNGHSASMRHASRTQCVSFRWLKQQFEIGQFELINVGTTFQVADILTKPFTSAPKWQHALRLIGIGTSLIKDAVPCKARAFVNAEQLQSSASVAQNQGGIAHENRLLVEFCCSADSKLGQTRAASKGCNVLRITEDLDATSNECQEVIKEKVSKFRKQCPKGSILFYASLPCTGGSPWGNVNKETPHGAQTIAAQQEDFKALFKSWCKVLTENHGENCFIAFELSKNCKYWSWSIVNRFLSKYCLTKHSFHGCCLGVKGLNGLPMKKGWTIASDIKQLEGLEQYKCNGQHKHDESRGKALKQAEQYTYDLTDFIHRCFAEAVESSKATSHPSFALPAVMAVSMLDAWDSGLEGVMASFLYMDLGYFDRSKEFAEGVASQYTAQSLLNEMVKEDHFMWPVLKPLIDCPRRVLNGIAKPGVNPSRTVHILVSDSALAMISGGRKNRVKHSFEEFFESSRPATCQSFRHRMCWGRDLQYLCKEASKVLKESRSVQTDAPTYVVVYWNGNELVGKNGIQPTNRHPFDEPEGDYHQLMSDSKRHITWLLNECRKNCATLALLTGCPGDIYDIPGVYDLFYKELKNWFFEECQGRDAVWCSPFEFAAAVELKDQYHMTFSEVNQHYMSSWFTGYFHLLNMRDYLYDVSLGPITNAIKRGGKRGDQLDANPSPRTKASDWFQKTLQDVINRRHDAEVQAKATAFTRQDLQREQPDLDELVSEVDYEDYPEVLDEQDEIEMELDDPAEAVEQAEVVQEEPRRIEAKQVHVVASNTSSHYDQYTYGFDGGKPAVLLNGHPHELIPVDGWSFEDPPSWWNTPRVLKDRLPYIMKILRGHALQSAPCEFDDGFYVDIDDFVHAIRKDKPELGKIKVIDIMNTAKIDKKDRFEFLCAAGTDRGRQFGQTYWPFKIRASQGHSRDLCSTDDKAYQLATLIYANPELEFNAAAFGGKPKVQDLSEIPEIVYHRTTHSAVSNILKNGLLVAGGKRRDSGKAHIYLSDKRVEDAEYQSGLRRKCAIQLKIDFRQAVKDGLIAFRTRSEGILTDQTISNVYIIAAEDTEKEKVLWTRSVAKEKSQEMPAIREDESYMQPTAKKTPTKRKQEEGDQTVTLEPNPKVKRSVTLDAVPCQKCGTKNVEGGIQCIACSEPLTGVSHEVKERLHQKRLRMLEEAGFGTNAKLSFEVINTVINKELGKMALVSQRGGTSPEAQVVTVAKNHLKRAKEFGFHDVMDRYDHDSQFAERMAEANRTARDIEFFDILSCIQLPAPQRSKGQRRLAIGSQSAEGLNLVKLVYLNLPSPEAIPSPYKERFNSLWGIMYVQKLWSEKEFTEYIENGGRYTKVLTWAGVRDFKKGQVAEDFAYFIEESEPLVRAELQRAEQQARTMGVQHREAERAKRAQQLPRTEQSVATPSSSEPASSSSTPWVRPAEPAYPPQTEWHYWKGQWWQKSGGQWVPYRGGRW